eukprot:TRINITY_DN1624_c0_g1_i1.p1 TRINITY_DN1624_c0_g1~~TRINITY_DN1624_c0_g1_i1.p1  ORF type:complete len:144 (+),score=44.79 TRINITY_DN1624_c0_g1_i1:88-519(+)
MSETKETTTTKQEEKKEKKEKKEKASSKKKASKTVTLTLEQADEIITNIISELNSDAVKVKLDEAFAEAEDNQAIVFSKIVPIFYEVQGKLMGKYGFEISDDGYAQLADNLKKHESNDSFNEKAKQYKAIVKKYTTFSSESSS